MIRILIEQEVSLTVNKQTWQRLKEKAPAGENEYGWADAAPFTETRTVKILEQFVPDDLDIPAVIAVINGLEKAVELRHVPYGETPK